MQPSTATEHHKILRRLTGEWRMVSSTGHPDYDPEDPAKRWTETGRMLGDLWAIIETRGPMPDGEPAEMLMTIGYDPALGRYTGTWTGSMMDYLWIYRGWVEDEGQTLVLEADGPDFDTPGKSAVYRDVIRFLPDGTRSFTGSVQQQDGTFREFMTHILAPA